MKRSQSQRRYLCAAMLLAVANVGCAALIDKHDSIIQVQSSSDPVKAQRLTLAGVSAMEKGHIDYAFEKLVAAIDADQAYGPAHNNIGLLHYDDGNLYQAVLAFERAMELMPQDPTVYYNLALTLEAAGKVSEAMDLYWQAVEMDPTEPHYLGNLVRLRIRLDESGPEVESQLRDLILIETRPEWRRWADRQLALDLNMALDRGPETPDFDSNDSGDKEETDDEKESHRVIDLTPEEQKPASDVNELPKPRVPAPPEPRIPRTPATVDPELNEPAVESKPIPIRSDGAFESLPPSIEMSPEH